VADGVHERAGRDVSRRVALAFRAHDSRSALAVTPWLTIQPDVQYIVRPGGKSSVSNALVVGVQLSLQS